MHCSLYMWKHLEKFLNSQIWINRMCPSIDRKMKKFNTKPLLFDRFSIPVRSIENNIRLIERNSRSIETMKNFIIVFLPKSIGSWFLFDQSKGILNRLKLAKLNFSQNFLVTAFDIFTIFHQKTPFDFMNEDSQIKH